MQTKKRARKFDELFSRIFGRPKEDFPPVKEREKEESLAPVSEKLLEADTALLKKIPVVNSFNFVEGSCVIIGTQVAEKFRELRTNLFTLKLRDGLKSFVFTSCHHGEGKTTIAINLAVFLAKSRDLRILIADCDLRRPQVKKYINYKPEFGLEDVIEGKAELHQSLVYSRDDNLYVLLSRRGHSNAAELLESPKMGEIMKTLISTFDIILIDSSPILSTTDPTILGRMVDGIILVIKTNQTQRESVTYAKELFEQAKVKVIGMILNHLRYYIPRYLYRYQYYEDYYYHYYYRKAGLEEEEEVAENKNEK